MQTEQTVSNPQYVHNLINELNRTVSGEVRFDHGTRATYSTDASKYRQIPIGVVVPESADDVIKTFAACRKFGAPITSRGGGTSLAGQCCNVAVVIDYSKYMDKVISIDPDERLARVQPGCKLDTLRDEAARHGLTFGPDPATHNHNTLGGMIGNNSCGIHSVLADLYGPGPLTRHNVHSLDVLTYDGTRFTAGATDDASYAAIVSAGGGQAEIYRALRELSEHYQTEIRTRYPGIPRRVSGFNLDALLPEQTFNIAQALVGTEGTCVAVLEATVKLIPARSHRTLVVLGYPTVYEAGDHVTQIMRHKPVGLEGIDDRLVDYMKQKGLHPDDVDLLPDGSGWLLVEFGDESKEQANAAASGLIADLKRMDDPPSIKLFEDRWEEEKLWQVRESGLGATAHVPAMHEAHPGWEDASVAPENVGKYLREFRQLLDEFDYDCALYGHFGQGCIHCRITFDLQTEPGIQHYLRFIDRAADLVIKHRGSLSGEHGDGQARAALLTKMYGDRMVEAFGKFKAIFDPTNRMNPGKVVDPYAPSQNLRHGPKHYRPAKVETVFQFPSDGGSFANAVNRCVGVGKCRRDQGGVMCPSYMATREEEHSTRGRSRILFEMLQGDVLPKGLKDKSVRKALDLCLACKGCKHECPVNVDMATYKAEFYSHYYHRRLRPRQAYAMGWIYWWARLASKMPKVVNFFATTKPFNMFAKWSANIAQQRSMPTFAHQTFRNWFETTPRNDSETARPEADKSMASLTTQHEHVPRFQTDSYADDAHRHRLHPAGSRQTYSGSKVILWPDTFNNFLNTDAAIASTHVLRKLGYDVELPSRVLCCGRPLYDWGMLTTARKLLLQTIEILRPQIVAGIPIIGIEPSCIAVFRDELTNLLPHDADARRLSRQTFLLSEFLQLRKHALPKLHRKAVVHGHCHHKSIIHMDAEVSVMKELELDYQIVQTTCCGMAGSFGFAADHYDVSVQVAKQGLLQAVQEASDDTLIIANGFSCQQQIKQLTHRHPHHIAEIIEMAMKSAM
ncbi:MAG: FAD-binding and (Fe-S)-binding domain-containing protein [Pirellulaceae bacterium]